MRYVILFVLNLSTILCVPHKQGPWTWCYRKLFTPQEREHALNKTEIHYSEIKVAPFTQLLFCWNALRPLQGHFSFWIQVRSAGVNAEGKKTWSSWHRMGEWGAQVQRSFLTAGDALGKFCHVRFEVSHAIKADAFRVKIKAHENAPLELIHALSVSVSDFTRFVSESSSFAKKRLPSILIEGVPTISQFELIHPRNDGLCSPTSCSILLTYLLQDPVDPCDFAEKAFDRGLDKYGSWPFNMAHAFERCEGKVLFIASRLNSFTSLLNRLQSGVPVIVSVRGRLTGAPKEYANGHLMVIVGFDGDRGEVICHDPAAASTQETVRRYGIVDFIRAWERSHRLAYCAEILPEKIMKEGIV